MTLSPGMTVVVRVRRIGGGLKEYRIGRVDTVQPDGKVGLRIWMGLRWPRGVRWSHRRRSVPAEDVKREATARETILGHLT